MNDRFRFRAWYKDLYSYEPRPRMLYDAEQTYDALTGRPEAICEECFGSLLDDEEYIVEQCTGLKDKNGRLIYEGDMFELEEGVADTVREVVWDKDTSSFKVSCRGKEEYNNGLYNEMREYEELLDLSLFLDCACIIGNIHEGNIHENADLLEEKTEKPTLGDKNGDN